MDPRLLLYCMGWDTWYNENYFVYRKNIADESRQDYTNYGMNMWDALQYEEMGCPKFSPRFGIPYVNMITTIRDNLPKDQLKG